ncbi:MAG: monovalent cation/H+ antiporter subunit A [Geminicoccaceae bacterium]
MQLALIVLLPFVGALLPPLLIRAGRNTCATATFLVTLTAFLLLLVQAPAVLAGKVLQFRLEWLPLLGLDVNFFLDGYGFLFAGLILFIGLLIITYARFYLSREDPMGRFMAYLLLFQGAMVGIVLSDNILLLLIFWELTSLSSFLLIGYWNHLPEGRQGARMALIVTGSGGLSMIAGMLLLGQIAGSYDLTVILSQGELIKASPLYLPALLLILGGCFTKSAQFPFHFWLPHAMAAPTPVSAYLHSATMVKAGIFLLGRLWPALAGTEEWFYLVATTGLVTMTIAAWIALFKNDLKALLAYSTVSHLGLVTMLFGFGTPFAAVAGVLHIINHATFKCALFMTAGIVDHSLHTRDIRRLGGLMMLMPVTGTIAVVAAFSMAGIPPFNGFLSKELMLEAAAHADWLGSHLVVGALATLAALFSAAYSFRYVFHVFIGRQRTDYPSPPHDPPFGMWAPPAILVLLVVLIGLFPNTMVGPLLAVSAGAVTGGRLPEYSLALWHGITPALLMSITAVLGGALLLWRYREGLRLRELFWRPEAKAIFEGLIELVVAGSRWGTTALQNGSLQRYLAITISAAIVIGYAGFLGSSLEAGTRAPLHAPWIAVSTWLVLITACAAVVVLHRRRLFALIVVGVLGLIVSVAFLYLSAPDLALTQISVEVVTVVLMLLALNFLPKESLPESPPGRRVRDGIIAGLAGLGIAFAMHAVLTRDFSTISDYHVANSKTGGGGTNVVNVILVDFRGFDTYGEIIVLGIAALTIFALLDTALQGACGRRLMEWQADQARSADRHPMMMVVGTRAMLPLALMVGVYIFLRGHNEPGGGFIAGLVVAIALLMQYMASGFAWAQERARVDYHAMIATGVLAAGLTGIAAWFFGWPFLKSTYTYLHVPFIGEVEVASAMGFDLGVFLCVVGSVMLALANLSRIGRIAEHLEVPEGPMDVDPSKLIDPAVVPAAN